MKGPWVVGTGLAALLAGVLLGSSPPGVAGVGDRPMQAIRGLPPAPALELPDDEGRKTWRLADLRGKVVLVNFWATWCPPCRREIPYLISLNNKYHKKGVMFVGVAIDEDEDTVKEFVDQVGVNYKILLDSQGRTVGPLYKVGPIPQTYLIDRKGKIRYAHIGFSGAAEAAKMENEIKKLVAEK